MYARRSLKNWKNIPHMKKIISGFLVHVLANVIRIVRMMNTWKFINAQKVFLMVF